ncbi:hypothetical protein EMIHUDRAFT_116687 [Emiliania huxleyi CCMP1516]|uniref:Uncharacterized protein n=2 Tax=Emiliania huxleyi TaxID=2903 RepID=A0A0D3JGA0_EMIH1|nr:hypothetical protein EMIHUDRAFT_116687 [Emiliania huxleyi CCMP1516]EOD22535.1 hypothetical protein EMIHUDRAFT_116687 [Emiliania huxleyi CCMP1516]|eukprot:XP_005774964.1 hypothetical protein EMIHUDRAFT_116687 [Emiliania huxleyi CCMP1516]
MLVLASPGLSSPRGGAVSCVARLRSPKPLAQYEDPGPEHLRTVDGFLGETAETLRTVFDERFEEPRQAHPMRFCWDYWHVPSQYTLHRTQAASYFDEDAFAALTDALTAFGQRELGCRAISPPWLSFYVDGCEQRLHADGPFAFVLSLTRWEERRFSGVRDLAAAAVSTNTRGFDSSVGLERGDLVAEAEITRDYTRLAEISEVQPLFDRLTVFDARLPHGTVAALRHLADTLVVDPSQLQRGAEADDARPAVLNAVETHLGGARFAPSGGNSSVTVPFLFD